MMKNLRYIVMLATALTIGACQTEDMVDLPNKNVSNTFYVGKDNMEVNISFNIDMSDTTTPQATTRNAEVSGVESYVTDFKLICFDAEGLFLGFRDVPFKEEGSYLPEGISDIERPKNTAYDDDHYYTVVAKGVEAGLNKTLYEGHIKCLVPDNTARIHFVANRDLQISGTVIGRPEESVMNDVELATTYDRHDHWTVAFWGYHREVSADAMATWLKNEEHTSKVQLIRDRVRIELEGFTREGGVITWNDENIEKIEWCVSNGLKKGYIAPFNEDVPQDPYSNYVANATQAVPTEHFIHPFYPASSADARFTADESDLTLYDGDPDGYTTISDDEGHTAKQLSLFKYAFEDDNPRNDPIKVILKVTYKNTVLVNNPVEPHVKYHTLILIDKNMDMMHVQRNRTYALKIVRLNQELGSNTFADAISTENYSNDQLNYVAQVVKNMNIGTHVLQIPAGTSMVLSDDNLIDNHDGTSTFTLDFNFFKVDENNNRVFDSSKDLSDFKASIVGDTDPMDYGFTYTYNAVDNGAGKLTFKVKNPTSSLVMKTLRVRVDNNEQVLGENVDRVIIRDIYLYIIKKFEFPNDGKPTLVKTTQTHTVNGQALPVYKLTFQMPPIDASNSNRYPTGLYPVHIQFATSTLNAFQSNALTGNTTFDVVLDKTDDLEAGHITNTEWTSSTVGGKTVWTQNVTTNGIATTNDWNYNVSKWGYYYDHELRDPVTPDGGTTYNKEYEIYFTDIRSQYRQETPNINSVGLYFRIEHFGDPIVLYVND